MKNKFAVVVILGVAGCLMGCSTGDVTTSPDANSQKDGVSQDGWGNLDHDNVCKTKPFDSHCGQSCISSSDCGANLYCGSDSKCRADCTPGGSECGAHSFCIDNGRCSAECASVSVNLDLIVPTVVFLIDQSGSMSENFGGQSRWNAVKNALCDSKQGVVTTLASKVIFGTSLYTSHGGSQGGTCPLLKTTNPKLDNQSPICKLIGDNGPDGDTPTGESLKAIVALLDSLPAGAITSARTIVLATDGEPDTCAVPNPQTGQANAIQGAQFAFQHGVRTVVLSVGSDVGASHLQDMANAGAGLPVGGTQKEPYYVANDPAELAKTFGDITQKTRTCVFVLNGEVKPLSFAVFGDVRLNGSRLTYEDGNGWRMVNGTTLQLLGSACQTYLNNPNATLTAQFPCGSIYVP